MTRTKEEWTKLLHLKAKELRFNDGFHLLYSPWDTIQTATVAFISLNPGRALPANMYLTSDERGNSYEVEENTTLSPLTPQFLEMCRRFSIRPRDILTGVAAPFRSDRWKTATPTQKRESLAVGKQFWTEVVKQKEDPLRVFITVSAEANALALALTGATEEKRIPSRWANTQLVRYRNSDGHSVVSLPHLSSYKLFSRAACTEPLNEIFRDVLWA